MIREAPKKLLDHTRVLNGCHDFKRLFECLEKNLALVGLEPPPGEFYAAKKLLDEIEEGDETRLRYGTVRSASWTKKRPKMVSSFGHAPWNKPKIVKFDELSEAMSKIASVHYKMSKLNEEPSSLLDHVAECSEMTRFTTYCRLDEVDKATRGGEVIWNATREPALIADGNPDLKDAEFRASLAGDYLFVEHDGRRFVVLCFRDATRTFSRGKESRENAYFFARQRPDGTLSKILDAEGYNSNMIRSAIRSWRRLPDDLGGLDTSEGSS